MLSFGLAMSLALAAPAPLKEVTPAQKKAFLELLARLPTRGEFFTAEAIQKAGPHTRVLLALTEKDLAKGDLYPFLALSRGLCDDTRWRADGLKRFGTIAHPRIKLAWGAMLFNGQVASAKVVRFLNAALNTREQAEFLEAVEGPHFEDFKTRVMQARAKGKKK